ncbi:hypothetical protein [Klenkia sp. PcliD-1-E]|uniref:hypothetical protein n=1 Tax=Klenkia sp. PcliD-1-E TaxID=2954492 RepID=UPI0020976E0E|nr:hypothetical protein [Klenkia sp. PcliD-1-E]MCO7221229.1 hypothetical protein [Klenkia sp. PcliD-1-E]
MSERDGGWQTWGAPGDGGPWQPGPQQPGPQQPGPQQPGPQQGPASPQPSSGWPQGAWHPAQGPAPWAPQPARRNRRTPLLVGGAALLVLLLVGGGLWFLLRGDDLSYAGRTVAEPQRTVDDGEAALDAYVADRGGATGDGTGCWFRFLSADTSDVQDDLVCGPVLFVDGDPSAAYLEFPLTPSQGGGDVTFEVAAQPADPEPQPLADRELLSRPDGRTPPDGAGDLTAPEPRAADPGFTADGPFEDVELAAPDGPATLSGASARVTVTGLATADRVGAGDDARRPADGEVFRVFRYTVDRGEGYGDDAPLLSYAVDGGDEVPVDPSLVTPGASIEGLVSAPADAGVQLVVVDGENTQTLSLVDGTPGADNLQVTTRQNRDADPVPAQQIPGVISAPGRVTTPFTFTVTIQSASLSWFAGTNVTARPAAPDRAFLVIDSDLVADTFSAGEGPPQYFSLTLPDGTVVPAQDIVDDPALVATAFDVPADFTTGTITFGGVFTYPDGATVDFQPGTLSFPVTVPAG